VHKASKLNQEGESTAISTWVPLFSALFQQNHMFLRRRSLNESRPRSPNWGIRASNKGLAVTGTGKDCLPIRALLLRLLRLILLLRFLGAVLASGVSNRLFCGGGLIHGSGLSD
jgi:hypothetical protein